MALTTKNDRMPEGQELASVVISMLREYADMLERHEAGDNGFEIYEKSDGTKLNAIGTTWGADEIPYEPAPLYRPRAS